MKKKRGKKKKVKSNLTVPVNDETNFVCCFVWNEKNKQNKNDKNSLDNNTKTALSKGPHKKAFNTIAVTGLFSFSYIAAFLFLS